MSFSPSTAAVGVYHFRNIESDSAATCAVIQTNVVSLNVSNALSASIEPDSLAIDEGQTASFALSPTGGTGNYTY
jgi:hypothetical protein